MSETFVERATNCARLGPMASKEAAMLAIARDADAELAALQQERDALLGMLAEAQKEFCSMRCPSVFRSADEPRHIPACDAMRAALATDTGEPPALAQLRQERDAGLRLRERAARWASIRLLYLDILRARNGDVCEREEREDDGCPRCHADPMSTLDDWCGPCRERDRLWPALRYARKELRKRRRALESAALATSQKGA